MTSQIIQNLHPRRPPQKTDPPLADKIQNSSALRDAEQFLVGGVNSPVRAFRHVGEKPIMLEAGRGAEVVDIQGRRWLDFIMGWGALILGHRHPAVSRALRSGLSRGTVLGLTTPGEIELARCLLEAVPSVEQVRFTVSGSEACMIALRLARAETGRSKLLLFDGCYHGHGDSLMAGRTAGLPQAWAQDTVRIPYNDARACESIFQRFGSELAAVLVEPVAANMGVVMPEPGYLARLRELATRHGALLIFDEIVTGFRVGAGGAQGYVGVRPDLTTFGKIIGGGLPIGAVGGPRRLMRRLAPDGEVYHAGTFAGHPLTMAAGIATLKALRAHPPYEALERVGARLVEGLLNAAIRSNVPIQINRIGSMLTVFFSETPVRQFAHARAARRERFGQWARALMRHGMLIPPSPYEALFLSTVHTDAQIDRFIHASHKAFRSLGRTFGGP